MTTATEFLQAYARSPLSTWEKGAVALASSGGLVTWNQVPVDVTSADGQHTGTFYVASDYAAVGTPEDYIRLPLTPTAAQAVANASGMLLPTPKMVAAIWKAGTKLTPQPMVPNKGADLQQYANHSRAIDAQLMQLGAFNQSIPVAGQKKDIVLSNIWKPGKVVIYGWHRPDGTRIQPLSNVHGDFYVDYSHGVRLVNPIMLVDGETRNVTDVLQSRELASLLSDEGPIKTVRYPTAGARISLWGGGAWERGSETLLAQNEAERVKKGQIAS